MPHRRWMPLRTVMLIAGMMAGPVIAARAQAVWMMPRANEVSGKGFFSDADYPRLFEPGAPWQRALGTIQVFGLGPHFAATAPEEELRRLFAFLRAHNVGLTVAWPAASARPCERHTEGMSFQPRHSLSLAMRLRRLGAPLTYISLDEPLHFGYYNQRHNRCSYTIDSLAAGVAENIREVKEVFPGIKVVDVEPLTALGPPPEIGQWITALRREAPGSAPVAMIFDVQWRRPWWTYVPPIIGVLRNHNLDYGVIFNGSIADRTDDAWMAAAQRHIEQWRSVALTPPTFVVIESWNDHPTHVLPESDPTTLPYLVNWYCTRPFSHCAAGGG